jgi:Trk K+ transport system NAD-binding subunit
VLGPEDHVILCGANALASRMAEELTARHGLAVTAIAASAASEHARRMSVRLYDDDLAERVQRTVANTVSRSTSYLAAPAFTAAMLDHQVLRTIAVGRHVLLLADVPAGEGGLVGQRLAFVHQPGRLRVIAVRRAETLAVDWSSDPGYVISAGDSVLVLATRAGLSRLLRRDDPLHSGSTSGI